MASMFPNITFDLDGKIRSKTPSSDYLAKINKILAMTKPGLKAVITSGGQSRKGSGGPRTGSTRHDEDEHGHVGTSDIVLASAEGKTITPGQDPALYEAFIKNAANYFPGIGHYSWGIHVGGGSEAFWGPSKSIKTADPRFLKAFKEGRAGASGAYDPSLQWVMEEAMAGSTQNQAKPFRSFDDAFMNELMTMGRQVAEGTMPLGIARQEQPKLSGMSRQEMAAERMSASLPIAAVEGEPQGDAESDTGATPSSMADTTDLDSRFGGPLGQGLLGLAAIAGKVFADNGKRDRVRHPRIQHSPFPDEIIASML